MLIDTNKNGNFFTYLLIHFFEYIQYVQDISVGVKQSSNVMEK